MKYHMPFTFPGWERIRRYGQQALLANRWVMQERMVPMHADTSAEFADVKEMLRPYGLEAESWVIFARPGRNTQVLHSDCAAGPDARAQCALNVPVVGGPGSRMEWFADRPMVIVKSNYGRDNALVARYYVPAEKSADEPIETAHFGEEPILVNVYNPHRVVSAKEPRAIVSIRFAGNPSLDEVRLAISQRHPVE